ncbi:unnamed protein product [Urochloa decumbens]|uniref:VWFA domain-containing protein n=1 Tax=Urochloa decumbens TaxID=240449 RepID=A0ABC9BWJ7_9POAL
MALAMCMSGRRCPVVFGGIGHARNIFTAQCSNMSSVTAALGSVDNHDEDEEDDEPVEPLPADAAGNGVLVLKTHCCEYPSIPNDAAHGGFAVMVTVKAPSLIGAEDSGHTPVDLVTVLDVSGSMAGAKLEHVKRAMGFVIGSLGPRDRLAVVAFSDGARRLLRLTRMSEAGKAAAKRAVESLAGAGSTNVRAGLDEAAAALAAGSRHDNAPVATAAVILLSDGYDNYNIRRRGSRLLDGDYSDLLPPPFLVRPSGGWPTPVHAFGFGSEHDEETMHGISAATGGTFTFVEDHAAIHDALARCAAGIRSVTAQGVWVDVECQFPGVRVTAVKSGRYESGIRNLVKEGHHGWVDAGELYADEERRFLFFLDVHRLGDARRNRKKLVKVRCNYLDTATGQVVDVAPADTCARAPPSDMEVERELVRVASAEDIALALAAAERGDHAEAARILGARRESVSGDGAACGALAAELHELGMRVGDAWEYKLTGRACLLAAMSAHAQQRGASVRLPRPFASGMEFEWAGSAMFATPAMRRMEKLSETLRERQRQVEAEAAAPPANGSRAVIVVPRPRLEARLAAAALRLSMLRKYRRLVLKH